MTQTRKWSLMTAVAVVVIVALGWLLLLSPARAETAALRSDTQAQDDANAQERMDIARLKQQAAEVEEYRAKLAKLEKRIPLSAHLPKIIRSLQAVTDDVGVEWVTFEPLPPRPLTPSVPGAPASGGTDPNAAPQGAPAASTGGLHAVVINMRAEGTYAQMEKLLRKIEDLPRAFLVTSVSLSSDNSSASPKLELRLSGQVFTRSGSITAAAPAKATPRSAAAKSGKASSTTNLG